MAASSATWMVATQEKHDMYLVKQFTSGSSILSYHGLNCSVCVRNLGDKLQDVAFRLMQKQDSADISCVA